MSAPHKFSPGTEKPANCVFCGRLKTHQIHKVKGRKRARVRWNRLLNPRRDWSLYGERR